MMTVGKKKRPPSVGNISDNCKVKARRSKGPTASERIYCHLVLSYESQLARIRL